jgi:hypothetical protein
MNIILVTLVSLAASYDEDYADDDENESKNKDIDENENENENENHSIDGPPTITK